MARSRLERLEGVAREEENMALLNRYQKNRLTIVLRSLEDELDLVRDLVTSDPREKILSRTLNPLPQASRQKVTKIIETAKKAVERLAKKFDLEQTDSDNVAAANAFLSTLWALLCDTNAKSLKGYGNVDEGLSSQLDPEITRLLDLVTEMKDVLSLPSSGVHGKVETRPSAAQRGKMG